MKQMISTMTKNYKSTAIIITAAGSSTRMGGQKKELIKLAAGGTVLSAAVNVFSVLPKHNVQIKKIIITVPAQTSDENVYLEALRVVPPVLFDKIQLVRGGKTRQESVFNALLALETVNPEIVLIHDGARPFVSEELILSLVSELNSVDAAAPGIVPVDTIKLIDNSSYIKEHLLRKNLVCIQTPQLFIYKKILEAHKKASHDNKEYTDDTEIFENYCGKVKVIHGDENNIKITYPADLEKLNV